MSLIQNTTDAQGNSTTNNNNKVCVLCQITGENLLGQNEILTIMQYSNLQYSSFVGYVCKAHNDLYYYDYEDAEWIERNPQFEKAHRKKINEIVKQLNKYIKNNKVFPDIELLK